MKVLKAPTDITVDRITSVGTVSFVEGIATEFTDEQAAHFQDNIGGYKVIELDSKEAPKTKEQKKTTETKKAKEARLKIEAEAEKERLAKKDGEGSDENPDGIDDGTGEPAITKIEVDETTPYPKLVAWVKEFKIPTPDGKGAEALLKACLADERFQPTKPKE